MSRWIIKMSSCGLNVGMETFAYLPSLFRSVLWHCWLGDRKGIRPVKHWMLVCWWWWFDWSFTRLIAPVITTTSMANSAIHPSWIGKWVVIHVIRYTDYGVNYMADWGVVCLLAVYCGPSSPLARAMGCEPVPQYYSQCQSAATSKVVKCCCPGL